MSVSMGGNVIVVAGNCGVEEAETLVALIQAHPGAEVDVSQAAAVHTSLWQVILALRPCLVGTPHDPFIRDWIVPNLAAGSN
ncbi:MAG: hypothetical protein JWQ65_347 [Devosia sp.]|nr:hypothetical protein [Devosia sp.]